MSKINLNKNVFNKEDFLKTVNTSFTQLIPPTPVEVPAMNVDEFFAEYDRLFFQIPRNGANGSHEELVSRSSSYIGVTGQADEIQALLDEINDLRTQLITAQQEIVNLSTTI